MSELALMSNDLAAAAVVASPGCAQVRCEWRAVTGNDQCGDLEHTRPSCVQRGAVRGEWVFRWALRRPPQVGECRGAFGGSHERGDVLGGMPGCLDQSDGARE